MPSTLADGGQKGGRRRTVPMAGPSDACNQPEGVEAEPGGSLKGGPDRDISAWSTCDRNGTQLAHPTPKPAPSAASRAVRRPGCRWRAVRGVGSKKRLIFAAPFKTPQAAIPHSESLVRNPVRRDATNYRKPIKMLPCCPLAPRLRRAIPPSIPNHHLCRLTCRPAIHASAGGLR